MLTRTLTAGLAVVLLNSTLLRADDLPKGDKDLEGTWELISFTKDDGQPATLPVKLLMIVNGTSTTYTSGGQSRKATISVDPSKSPRTIDVTPDDGPDKGMVAPGIYQINGDELLLCGAVPGEDRPTDFTPKAGSGWMLKTFKRVKK